MWLGAKPTTSKTLTRGWRSYNDMYVSRINFVHLWVVVGWSLKSFSFPLFEIYLGLFWHQLGIDSRQLFSRISKLASLLEDI